MRKYFLVDYENVTKSGLDGLNFLDDYCNVIVFYNQTSTVPIDLMISISKSQANFEWIALNQQGINALDLQLTTYLGSLIPTIRNSTEASDIFIVSKDNGYNTAIELAFNRFGIKVQKITSIGAYVTCVNNLNLPSKFDSKLYENIVKELRKRDLTEYIMYTGLLENIVKKSASIVEINNKLNAKFNKVSSVLLFSCLKAAIKITDIEFLYSCEITEDNYNDILNKILSTIDYFYYGLKDGQDLDNETIIALKQLFKFIKKFFEFSCLHNINLSKKLTTNIEELMTLLFSTKLDNLTEDMCNVSDYLFYYNTTENISEEPESNDVKVREVEEIKKKEIEPVVQQTISSNNVNLTITPFVLHLSSIMTNNLLLQSIVKGKGISLVDFYRFKNIENIKEDLTDIAFPITKKVYGDRINNSLNFIKAINDTNNLKYVVGNNTIVITKGDMTCEKS